MNGNPPLYQPDHPYIFGCAGNLALLHRLRGDVGGALTLNKDALTGLESRLAAVEDRVTGIDQIVRDLQPQVSTVLTRLDRQTDSLRLLEQRQAQRVSALNQVLENLSRLREEEPAPENSLPLM